MMSRPNRIVLSGLVLLLTACVVSCTRTVSSATREKQMKISGPVTTVYPGGSFDVQTSKGVFRVDTDSKTTIMKGSKSIAVSGLSPGTAVTVNGESLQKNQITARRVVVHTPITITGVIFNVEPKKNRMLVRTESGLETVMVSPKTKIERNGKTIMLKSLTNGSTVKVQGTRVDKGMISGKTITFVAPPRNVGPPAAQ